MQDRTFQTWLPRYINAIKIQNYSPNTIKMYTRTIDLFARFKTYIRDGALPATTSALDGLRISTDVGTNAHEINDFFVLLGELKPATVRQYSAALSTFYRFLAKLDVVNTNPMDKVDRPKIKEQELKYLQHNDVMAFIDFLANRPSKHRDCRRDALLVRTIYATGMRVSELCNLRIEDINFTEKTVRVLGKGGKIRAVLCDETTLSMIQDYIGDRTEGYVFLCRGHSIDPRAVQRIFEVYAPAGITPHKIRHSHATEMYKGSHDLRAVQENLGHNSIQTTQIYLHSDLEEQKKAYQYFPLTAGTCRP